MDSSELRLCGITTWRRHWSHRMEKSTIVRNMSQIWRLEKGRMDPLSSSCWAKRRAKFIKGSMLKLVKSSLQNMKKVRGFHKISMNCGGKDETQKTQRCSQTRYLKWTRSRYNTGEKGTNKLLRESKKKTKEAKPQTTLLKIQSWWYLRSGHILYHIDVPS